MIGSHAKWKGQWNGLLGKWTDSQDYPVGPFVLPGLQAYYDSSDVSSLVYDSAGRVSLLMDKSGNSQATCFVSNVAASNSLSAPTKSVLGNQLFSLDVGLDDYTPGSDVTIASKLSGNDGFAIQVLTTGVVRLRIGDGVSVTNVDSTASLSIADMVRGTIGIIWADGLGASFTQNGATLGVPVAAVKTLTNAAVAMTVGTITGRIYRFTALGFYDCNPAGATRGSTSFASGGDTWTLATSGATGARISGERDLYQGTVANQPNYLPWSGDNYGWLNAVAGNYASTPDSAAVSVTGDIDLIARCAANDWTAAVQTVIGKQTAAGNQVSYAIDLNASGFIRFSYSPDGTAASLRVAASTIAAPFTDRTTYWLRATYVAASGAVEFFYASDSATVPTSWTKLGNTVSITTGSIFDGTSPLEIGSVVGGTTNLFNGRIFRAQVYNGINGTLVADFNPSLYVSGPTFVASTGETWTVQGGAQIVTRTGLYFDGSNDYFKSAAFALSQPETVACVYSKVTRVNNDAVYDGGTVSRSMNMSNSASDPASYITSDGALFTFNNAEPSLQVGFVSQAVFNAASSLLRANRGTASTGNAGVVAGGGFTLGATQSGSSPANIFVSEVAIYNTALSTASQDALALYEGRKWRFTA